MESVNNSSLRMNEDANRVASNDIELGGYNRLGTVDMMKDDDFVEQVNTNKPQRVTCPDC